MPHHLTEPQWGCREPRRSQLAVTSGSANHDNHQFRCFRECGRGGARGGGSATSPSIRRPTHRAHTTTCDGTNGSALASRLGDHRLGRTPAATRLHNSARHHASRYLKRAATIVAL